MSSISIHWADLFKVAGVSLVFAVALVSIFSIGLLGISQVESARSGQSGNATAGYTIAGTCFAVCAAGVLYGLYLLIPQFH
jgi:hypothetical protein